MNYYNYASRIKLPTTKSDIDFTEEASRIAAQIAAIDTRRVEGIARGWFKEILGDRCPSTDEDIVTCALLMGYSITRIVAPTGNTDTLVLYRDGVKVREEEIPKPFPCETPAA